MASDSSTSKAFGKRGLTRWAVVVAVSVLLHIVALDWAGDQIGIPPARDETAVAVELQPMPASRKPEPPPAPRAVKPAPVKRPVRQARPKALPVAPPVHETAPAPTTQPAAPPVAPAEPSIAGMEMPTQLKASSTPLPPPPAEEKPQADASAADSASEAAAQAQPGVQYGIELPPSAELEYDFQKVEKEGNPTHGHGVIRWQSDGRTYTIDGDAGILFITALNFKSEGEIDAFGIAPVLYSEKRFRRSETNTHFHRERNTISFSASTATYPRRGGEQDRASIIWQLAAIGRGDREKFKPGAEIDLFVAGVRDAETWHIQVIGEEEIPTGSGKTITWHVVRIPRPGSYDQRFDIWFDPRQEWYPVKIRKTESNGDFQELSLSKINRGVLDRKMQ